MTKYIDGIFIKVSIKLQDKNMILTHTFNNLKLLKPAVRSYLFEVVLNQFAIIFYKSIERHTFNKNVLDKFFPFLLLSSKKILLRKTKFCCQNNSINLGWLIKLLDLEQGRNLYLFFSIYYYLFNIKKKDKQKHLLQNKLLLTYTIETLVLKIAETLAHILLLENGLQSSFLSTVVMEQSFFFDKVMVGTNRLYITFYIQIFLNHPKQFVHKEHILFFLKSCLLTQKSFYSPVEMSKSSLVMCQSILIFFLGTIDFLSSIIIFDF